MFADAYEKSRITDAAFFCSAERIPHGVGSSQNVAPVAPVTRVKVSVTVRGGDALTTPSETLMV